MTESIMSKKIHIIGSCVTRDIFRVLEKNNLVGQYAARSSLISRVSPPVEICLDYNLVNLNSNWQRRMVQQDFDKTGVHLDKYRQGILIIDFIDERLKLWKIGNSFVTQSTELVRLNLKQVLKPQKTLSRGSPEDLKLWTDACQKFTAIMPESIRNKTILHQAFWADSYIENGQNKKFDNIDQISFFNQLLNEYYEIFASIYSPAKIIEVKSDLIVADASHQWKLAPFHYVHEYYAKVWEEISTFL